MVGDPAAGLSFGESLNSVIAKSVLCSSPPLHEWHHDSSPIDLGKRASAGLGLARPPLSFAWNMPPGHTTFGHDVRYRGKASVFTDAGQPGAGLRDLYRELEETLRWTHTSPEEERQEGMKKTTTKTKCREMIGGGTDAGGAAAAAEEEDPTADDALSVHGRHFLLPAFFTTLVELVKRGRDVRVVVRTFGTDLPKVYAALRAFGRGAHPDYPPSSASSEGCGLTRDQLSQFIPPVDGGGVGGVGGGGGSGGGGGGGDVERGRVVGGESEDSNGGQRAPPWYWRWQQPAAPEATAGGATLLSSSPPPPSSRCSVLLRQEAGANDGGALQTLESKGGGVRTTRIIDGEDQVEALVGGWGGGSGGECGIGGNGSESTSTHNPAGSRVTLIQDDYMWWRDSGYVPSAGKPMWLTASSIASGAVHPIFFDDNLHNDKEDSIVRVRVRQNLDDRFVDIGDHRPLHSTFLVRAHPVAAVRDPSWFLHRIAECESSLAGVLERPGELERLLELRVPDNT